ncbi:PREDICTED: ribosomal protein S6 kinase-like 1 [Cyprinodon variegatus]|uniref:Ribosomal protein S6 kinase-like 1 n=1 Tax=Cyprinodon variegatus TaxID=28743 RepID=A0A3Q2EIZ8_CYPVA|nr:PREDICTED: ribosomal protein S6 kinase-like 1 [Cyprinodon variegatus]XP_015242297.1 PREDICTED: ribosomal protein S6 kinase-like 1 [Cyprinodon variegatus]XP_015242298.1 PREDICTED: ribosomal protein S6 kinase-like 1 [Cyprinodon variegatus]XP_015242299.1 PREDICTED: ribosomal protein S6 kinase-like 1 [Cyprinodon variegatus]XP_015242300.1 PREDICTED: ribosomal protein S6 kinase-like 1 [Cyprinodon variegatus]XP_015242301.1 PREDICTED: ribosomal protein S6 kinase-like 1 [Cyprinodon variegatus]
MAKRDYLVEAAKQIRMALDSEVNEDYEAAFSYYKNGVDLLLNGVQLDPNKDRREAVKRKTTQYLKRAEEIFITHLQDNLGKGGSHLGGYSSLRFRPIRHLSSPVEDLEMCKVVGVTDKVLIVQSMVNKETFVVKSLVKSSWESRDQTTIIPQGVPYMVKLLRYYVSEDAVYLHLEHVKGGRLFSKLRKLRNEKTKEHPDPCFSSGHHIMLKTSHTSPSITTDFNHSSRSRAVSSHKPTDESPDTDFPNSWHETQQRLESCGTHSYIEETGCLQNTRSAASFYTKLDQLTLVSGLTRTQVNTQLHPPAPSLCLHSSEAQEKPALPLPCARVSQALDVMSELHKKKAGMGLVECSTDFEAAWEAADPMHSCTKANSYAVTGNHLQRATSQTNQTSYKRPESPISQNAALSSSPAILHLPLHCQTQIHGRASWEANASQQGSILGGSSEEMNADLKEESSPVVEERNGMIVIRSTDRAVFSDHTNTSIISQSSPDFTTSFLHSSLNIQGIVLDEHQKGENCPTEVKQRVEMACEVLSPGGKNQKVGSYVGWVSPDPLGVTCHSNKKNVEGPEMQGEDQIIEVDGWCHLPRFPTKNSRPADKALQNCWGLPEAEVRVWGAQILLALESLHEQGIFCRDLNPRNILLTSNGKVCLTFFSQWSEVQSEISSKAIEQMYCAPEIGGVSRITEACDWWSLGALLFELLTGMPLWQLHPAGIHSHTQLVIPDHLSAAAASLLTELLQFDAGYRLGSGGGGVSDIKCHPFFSGVSWKALSC